MNLAQLIQESYWIEGEQWDPTTAPEVLEAHINLINLPVLTVADCSTFVRVIKPEAKLRVLVGQDVVVGLHHAPSGGPEIVRALASLLKAESKRTDDACRWHHMFLYLHPYTDGNGRLSRAIFFRKQLQLCFQYGFLRAFYYQQLQENDAAMEREFGA